MTIHVTLHYTKNSPQDYVAIYRELLKLIVETKSNFVANLKHCTVKYSMSSNCVD
jgi:hypothetical protein